MKTVTLGEYLATHGTQSDLAKALDIQQSAVSQMHRSGRNINITLMDDGSLSAYEIKPIPARNQVLKPIHPPRTSVA
ncbi:Cro/CI family transcriptional regulator [Pseudomonas sp. RGM 3321]|uniref:Cro/CI family transcriptional regulator n=1 Tax=Pseudomonas sp. RGM 3321 TaxID=2930089 RepID=UPI001FCAE71D|nr:Cro/CI family transcriptional regulator [Pseudomonas sp. RGM 3321]MCJ2370182.1 Cro/CI family transcriptional regulator [Pseudomonas sp. RGM 3321]